MWAKRFSGWWAGSEKALKEEWKVKKKKRKTERERETCSKSVRQNWQRKFKELNFFQMHQKSNSYRAEQNVCLPRGFHLPQFNSRNQLCILKHKEKKNLMKWYCREDISFHVFSKRCKLSRKLIQMLYLTTWTTYPHIHRTFGDSQLILYHWQSRQFWLSNKKIPEALF